MITVYRFDPSLYEIRPTEVKTWIRRGVILIDDIPRWNADSGLKRFDVSDVGSIRANVDLEDLALGALKSLRDSTGCESKAATAAGLRRALAKHLGET